MLELLQYATSSFWVFVGCVVLVSLIVVTPIQAALFAWNRFVRHLNVRAKGWPPAHLDADGDWKQREGE